MKNGLDFNQQIGRVVGGKKEARIANTCHTLQSNQH